MKDINGTVIYVGKAKKLKNRVKSYFDGSSKTVKTYALVSNIEDFDYILTNSELDAFSLESNLIKKYKPKYNILLKDDKSFPYIRIDLKERFPRVTIARRPKKDGALLFGPYVTGLRISEIMSLIKWAFPIRWCNTSFENGKMKNRPCLHGEIGNCLAPCCYETREEEYNKIIGDVINFLNGDNREIKNRLKERMNIFAQRQQFEEALEVRNLLEAVDLLDSQLITSLTTESSIDAFALSSNDELTVINVMKIRGGKNVGQFNYPLEDAVGTSEELLTSFISSYYKEVRELPKEILLEQGFCELKELLELFLMNNFNKKVNVLFPQKGIKKSLLESAINNACEYAENSRDKVERHRKLTTEALEELKNILDLDKVWRIEGYDISNISGTNNVASMVVFEGGEPNKKEYRKFKIKSVEGANDFVCLMEAISRRIDNLICGEQNFSVKPDLILIDGGLGQLNSVKEVLQSKGVDIPVISLAKQDEEIYVAQTSLPIILERNNYALRLLQRVRDESHRFAVMYHRNLRGQSLSSFLQEIPGVGKKTSENIWKHFKTKENIFNATPTALAEVDGVSEKLALQIYEFLRKN